MTSLRPYQLIGIIRKKQPAIDKVEQHPEESEKIHDIGKKISDRNKLEQTQSNLNQSGFYKSKLFYDIGRREL